MWKRNEYRISKREFENIFGREFHRSDFRFSSTQMDDIGSWLLGEKVHYREFDLDKGQAVFVSEPVIDPAFVLGVMNDLGEDVEIRNQEVDKPFNPDITTIHRKRL